MKLQRIIDNSISNVVDFKYDLGIFASGYELRSNSISLMLNSKNFQKIVVFGFIEDTEFPSRHINDEFFLKNWTDRIIPLSSSDDGEIYRTLNNLDFKNKKELRILVDYSSMSRLWYAGILNWLKFKTEYFEVTVDFCYSVGEYKDEISPLIVEKIVCIPGCEGSTQSFAKSVALFGLGFDGSSTLWALDRLEPDIIFAYYSNPSVFPDYPDKTKNNNFELLTEHTLASLEVPLLSCETTFRYLGELISSYINNSDITIIPMGPKPHILVAILLCFRFKEITCLYIKGERKRVDMIKPTGHYSVCKVFFTS